MNRNDCLNELRGAIRDERRDLDVVEAMKWAVDFITGRPDEGPGVLPTPNRAVVNAIDEVCHGRHLKVADDLERTTQGFNDLCFGLQDRLRALESFKAEAGPMLGVGSGTVADRLGRLDRAAEARYNQAADLQSRMIVLESFIRTLATAAGKLE